MASIHSTDKEAVAEPAWQIAELFPNQGHLSEGDYLFLTKRTNRLVEFNNGQIEVLPMPTTEHQEIVFYLITLLRNFITPRNLGRALMSPLRMLVREGKFREPDVIFMLQRNSSRIGSQYWQGADLVMEVVSEDDPARDLQTKRSEYAEAGIAEYWIVDPRSMTISILKLENGNYVTFSETTRDGLVQSSLLQGFTADAKAVFAAGNPA